MKRFCRFLSISLDARTALAALVALSMLLVPSTRADAQPSTNWRDYRLIGLSEVDLGAQTNLTGNYAVIHPEGAILPGGVESNGILFVRNNSVVLSANPPPDLAADNVTLAAFASVVDVYTNNLETAPTSEVRGTLNDPHPFPLPIVLPALPAQVFDGCTLSQPDLVVPVNGNVALTPGCRGDLEVRQGASVQLAAGDYRFKSIDLDLNVTFVANGPVNIYVREQVLTSQGTAMGPASNNPDHFQVWVGADGDKRSIFGADNTFIGTFFDPNDRELNLNIRFNWNGTLVAIVVSHSGQHADREPACGDDDLNPGETCDPPGEPFPPNDNVCRNNCTYCGDGNKQAAEACDDGNANNNDSCRNNCTFCGDGVTQTQFGEECDDGNQNDNDECSNSCMNTEVCGDGTKDPGEFCDDGNQNNNDECRNNCTACGDGVTQAGEECDDGNANNNDACSNSCDLTSCGDGQVQPPEFCDDGNQNDNDSCRNNCTACGDGVTQVGEQCDDGNQNNNDACTNACTAPRCGDGIQQSGEFCDDGNQNNNDSCRNNCTACGDGVTQPGESCDPPGASSGPNPAACRNDCSLCGDGIVQASFGELCDDANGIDNDACGNDCQPGENPGCGDGEVQPPEFCDDGNANNNDGCRNDCTACGDGDLQTSAGEACDPPGSPAGEGTCRSDCTFCGDGALQGSELCEPPGAEVGPNPDTCRGNCTYCGDGVVQLPFGETCDDADGVDLDECSNECLPGQQLGCGNGVVDPGEFCDDGNQNNADGCRTDCTACGDGDTQSEFGEACDDGNDVDDDACSNDCDLTSCGDGEVQPPEACDDGNDDDNDGCRTDCTFCGDGDQQPGEECDDGNLADDDGCSNSCQSAVCGDGDVDDGETCDDGNQTPSDECRNDCTFCGDGIEQPGESCDDGNGNNTDECRNDCTFCGDGIVQLPYGETCDDGNDIDDDACMNACFPPSQPPPGFRKKPWGRMKFIGDVGFRGGTPSMRRPLARAK